MDGIVMRLIINIVNYVFKMDVSVFLLGEFGIGKSLFVRYIYYNSNRFNGLFIIINCVIIFL